MEGGSGGVEGGLVGCRGVWWGGGGFGGVQGGLVGWRGVWWGAGGLVGSTPRIWPWVCCCGIDCM